MALDDTPNKLESVWIQRNTENQYYEQINISGSDLIVYHSSSGEIQADKIPIFLAKYGAGGSAAFDGNRAITRTPYTGINLGTTTVTDFLDEFFFPFNQSSISINGGTTYYETGSSQNVSIYGTVTAGSETVFGSGSVRRSGYDWYTFLSASSYSTTDSGVTGSRIYQSFIEVGNSGSPVLIFSTTKSVGFLYPYLWGMSPVAGLEGSSLYSAMLTKSITVESTKTATLFGTATYIYFCFPMSYGAYTFDSLTSIKDPSNFEVLASFEHSQSVPITSSGLTNNWNGLYHVYRLNLQANPNGAFIFTHG